ncbi:MAG: hypothetical protein ACI9PP_001287 [Halobacteriales archaeon]|jgi:hypothetical protein
MGDKENPTLDGEAKNWGKNPNTGGRFEHREKGPSNEGEGRTPNTVWENSSESTIEMGKTQRRP